MIDELTKNAEEAGDVSPEQRTRRIRDDEFAPGMNAQFQLQSPGPSTPAPAPAEVARRAAVRADRAAGALIGAACGDALGVPYEFGRLGEAERPVMRGGGLGPYEPGEYSDDTQMQVVIAKVAASGLALDEDPAQRAIAEGFIGWLAGGASDVGAQTRQVLSQASAAGGDPLTAVRAASAAIHERTGRSAGNGSLMRTGVVGLAFLDGADGRFRCRDAARGISGLTHFDALAGDACVLWSEGVREAVRHHTPGMWRFYGVRNAVQMLPPERRDQWTAWLDEAQAKPPHAFQPNGYVVRAFQAAWSAIYHTVIPKDRPQDHFRLALEAAVHAGNDTDTVAAIAGALLGAAWGRSAIPAEWQRVVHGWPGLDVDGLAELTARITSASVRSA
ncbi:ADP-ribosylglycohydrolase family protein [Catenulispora sp. NL8]|uniref:ADP-ribosylglycohydrolase family protein n=1 Tax=Catenulispora pinistramenti TaxID=2705254 RepID=A0ABS5KGH8_9ACTN|nr:ADP-ribosylglycohydrolase family protein [Catenulispora pinistramenti]MBS2545382.1 ADP-ribosylglycohydrolase family protein [Catenulispora pinistramenti]